MKGASNIAPMGIRVPDDLKLKIQERARNHGRSMNAEIVQIIEDALNSSDSSMGEAASSEERKSYEERIEQMASIIGILTQTVSAYEEQVAMFKHILKERTGIDFQEYFNKTVDYDAIKAKYTQPNKKPT